jgi:hypothetical protein
VLAHASGRAKHIRIISVNLLTSHSSLRFLRVHCVFAVANGITGSLQFYCDSAKIASI